MSRRSAALGVGGALLLLLVPAALLAQDNQLDTMVNTALFASQDWLSRVLPEAQSLFLMLVGLEITVTVLVWAYMHLSGKLTLGGVLATTFQKVILLVLCSLSLQSFPMFLPKILALFQKAGGDIAGIQGLSPTSLLDQGIYLSSRVLYMSNQAGLFEIPVVITSLVLAFVLLVCFVLLAWRMTSLLIEGAILVSGGALFMGFSASRFTIQLAENYIISIIRLGAHTYLILFCIAVGNRLVPLWGLEINNYLYSVDGFAVLFRIAGEVLIFTLVTLRLPGDLAYKLTAPSGFLHLRGALVASY